MPRDQTPDSFQLPKLTCSRTEARRKLQERIDSGKELRARKFASEEGLDYANSDRAIWYNRSQILTRSLFDNPYFYESFSHALTNLVTFTRPAPLSDLTEEYRKKLDAHLTLLKSIYESLDEIEEPAELVHPVSTAADPKKVFIVYGHDLEAKEAVKGFLHQLELSPVVFDDEPINGRTIIEKLEHLAPQCSYAVVLLTGDDTGFPDDQMDKARRRARQNVIAELGYFVGKLGRSKVCALYKGEVELPSDFDGVLYVSIDGHDGWKRRLARELHSAQIPFDPAKAL